MAKRTIAILMDEAFSTFDDALILSKSSHDFKENFKSFLNAHFLMDAAGIERLIVGDIPDKYKENLKKAVNKIELRPYPLEDWDDIVFCLLEYRFNLYCLPYFQVLGPRKDLIEQEKWLVFWFDRYVNVEKYNFLTLTLKHNIFKLVKDYPLKNVFIDYVKALSDVVVNTGKNSNDAFKASRSYCIFNHFSEDEACDGILNTSSEELIKYLDVISDISSDRFNQTLLKKIRQEITNAPELMDAYFEIMYPERDLDIFLATVFMHRSDPVFEHEPSIVDHFVTKKLNFYERGRKQVLSHFLKEEQIQKIESTVALMGNLQGLVPLIQAELGMTQEESKLSNDFNLEI